MGFRSLVWLAACGFLCACSNDTATVTAPPPKVTLSVTGLVPVGEEPWYATAADSAVPVVTIGCNRTLAVVLEVDNFSLRAPNACGGAVQCGYDEVSLLLAGDGSLAVGPVQSASNAPVLDLSAQAPLAGDYLVHPELRTAAGLLYDRNYADPPLDLAVTLADGCDSGAGGAGGAGGTDGAAGVTGE